MVENGFGGFMHEKSYIRVIIGKGAARHAPAS